MTAIVSVGKHRKYIKSAVEEINVVIESYKKQSQQFFNNLLSLDLKNLIISKDAYENDFLLDKLSEFVIKKPETRIVVLVDNAHKGNLFVNELIKRGIYDICNFSKEEDAKNIKKLKKLLENKPQKYHDTLDLQNNKSQILTHNENLARKTIVFLNLTKKAGSTLIATTYAEYLAKKSLTPALVEMPLDPEYFYQFGLELYETKKKGFHSKPHQIKNMENDIRKDVFYKKNIMWLVSDPRKPLINTWNINEMLQLLECGDLADVVIIDVGDYFEHESIYNLLPMVDKIFAIIEPRPVSIIKSIEKIKNFVKYQEYNSRVKVIFNKWDKSLAKIGISDLIDIKPDITIPFLDKAALYKSEFNCLSAGSEITNLNKLKKPLQAISRSIWPDYNYKKVIKTKSFVAEGS
ncbi:MAG: hypothetical protein ACLFPS_01945 [Clostridia bacterium]